MTALSLESLPCAHCGESRTEWACNTARTVPEIVERCLVEAGAEQYEHTRHSYSWNRLLDVSGGDAILIVHRALVFMDDVRRKAEFITLEPRTGLGSFAATRGVMADLLYALEKHPRCVIRYPWWSRHASRLC